MRPVPRSVFASLLEEGCRHGQAWLPGRAEEESGLTGIPSGKRRMVSCQDSHEGSSLNMEMGVDLNHQGTNTTSCQLQMDFPKRV